MANLAELRWVKTVAGFSLWENRNWSRRIYGDIICFANKRYAHQRRKIQNPDSEHNSFENGILKIESITEKYKPTYCNVSDVNTLSPAIF